MSARSKKGSKKERRQQKRKKKQQRAQKRRAEPKPVPQESDLPAMNPWPEPVARTTPEPPERERTEIDEWWDRFADADVAEQVSMVREKLETVQPGDDWYSAVVLDSVHELENSLSESEYVAFLEELRTGHAAVFNDSVDWKTRSLVFFYAAEERWDDLDRAVLHYADAMTEVGEPFFSIMSLIRLVGRAQPAQRLIDAAMSPDTERDLMSWAIDELFEWKLFAQRQACAEAGATEEAIDALYEASLAIGCDASDVLRKDQRDCALHLAGKAAPFSRNDLLKKDRHAGRRVFLLTLDFQHWLCASRRFEPVLADELQRILVQTIEHMKCKPAAMFCELRREQFEPALARKLDVLSLDIVHAPAAVVAMLHFYDFLAEFGLVDARTRELAHTVCDTLWQELQRALTDDWHHYEFLERYLPSRRAECNEMTGPHWQIPNDAVDKITTITSDDKEILHGTD